ncbi:hypothetical protein BDV3_005400 [Batrachochytrium dendrobatidis]
MNSVNSRTPLAGVDKTEQTVLSGTDSLLKPENGFPDSLIDNSPPDSLPFLDKQMDNLLEDIRILIDARNKEFQITGEGRTRMPLIPPIAKFEMYKSLRKDNVEGILKVEMPSRKVGSSEVIQKETRQYWNIEQHFEGDRHLEILIGFFKEKTERILQENRLLVSRWSRFCRTSFDISRFSPVFKKRHEYLRREFIDSVNRYERLYEFRQAISQKRRADMATAEISRIDAERRGLAVLKPKIANTLKQEERKNEKPETNVSSNIMEEPSIFGQHEVAENPGFDVSDMVIYLRWMIGTERNHCDFNLFSLKSKMILHSDREQLLSEYHTLNSLKPGDDLPDVLNQLGDLNGFMNQFPLKNPKVEDFLTEYDLLVAHWKTDTQIDHEDGRPFAYEVDHKFFTNFCEQTMEVVLAPYDTLTTSNDYTETGEKSALNQYPGNSGLDSFMSSLAGVSGFTSKSSTKAFIRFPKLRRATWLNIIKPMPVNEFRQSEDRHKLSQLKNIDMELRLEHDMVISTDHEYVGTQLKDMAKRVWEKAAAEPNSCPLNVKISIIPQQREYKPPAESADSRCGKTFDFGMRMPINDGDVIESTILLSKKIEYGSVLKSIEDSRKIDMELLNLNPDHIVENKNTIKPTLATIFAEHEVFAYLQLRFIKIREIRVKLLRQFNFLRSVEKQLSYDINCIEKQMISNTPSNSAGLVAQMWRQAEFVDIGTLGDDVQDNLLKENKLDALSYMCDTRSIVNGKIQISDSKGVSFIYDMAFTDLENFETQMLKVITVFINQNALDEHVYPDYLDELRFRMSNRRYETSNATYLNPHADRSQMMLEFYEAHLLYTYSKIELINSYLEAYEHTTDVTSIKELAQIITNTIHTQPEIDFEATYYSKSYACATKALQLHAQIVVSCIRHTTTCQRDFCARFAPSEKKSTEFSNSNELSFSAEKSTPASVNISQRQFSSILNVELPVAPDDDSQTVVMHHPEITIRLTEFFQAFDIIISMWNIVQTLSTDMCNIIEKLSPPGTRQSKGIIDCVILKTLNNYWEAMSSLKFQPPSRNSRVTSGLDSNGLIYNPYLPDMLLSEHYVPYDQSNEGTYKSLGVQLSASTCFTDASFQSNGREIMYRLYKVLILRSRLWKVWIESENWKNSYDAQFSQMGVVKTGYTGRLRPLRFETGNLMTESAEDPQELEDAEDDYLGKRDFADDLEMDAMVSSMSADVLRFGPLSMSELDESMIQFDLSTIQGITSLMKPSGINRLKQCIKIQILDKNWFMAATELHDMLLEEIHAGVLDGKSVQQVEAAQTTRPTSEPISKPTQDQSRFDTDYRALVTSNLTKKKQLRRILMTEYSREYKLLSTQDITDNQKEQALTKFKVKLVDWYYANFAEVVAEECERTEFAKLISEIRKVISPITKHSDYFASLQDNGAESEKYKYKQSVQVQEVVSNDSGLGPERLARLWYLPHLTEIILAMSGPDKPYKGPIDLSHRIYRNKQLFFKSTRIHSLVYELLSIIMVFSHLLQDNNRYSTSVKLMREADYVVSTVNLIKRDLMNQGEPADSIRVQSFLSSRWQFWYLKLKYILSFSIHALEMKMLTWDRNILMAHYSKCITKKFAHLREPKRGKYEKPLQSTKSAFVVTRTYIPSLYVFGELTVEAKRICDFNVKEIEENIEEYLQVVQYNGSDENMNKSLTDFLTSNIKLLALRREYFNIITNGNLIQDEASRIAFFQKFKMRIIVPAVKMYHKTGSKGNASTASLIQDEIVCGNSILELNQTARNAFDKCQLQVLQNEIIRDFTQKLTREAQVYFDKLTDERLGKLFRSSGITKITSPTYSDTYAFQISEEDYNTKSSIFNTFLTDLHRASMDFAKELKDKQPTLPLGKLGKAQSKTEDSQLSTLFDDKKIFSCKKEDLGQAIVRLATHLNQWKSDRALEQEGFIGALYGHLLDTIRNCERIILFQMQEKRDIMNNFKREARLVGHELALDTYAELASMSVELNELRKNRKIDERKIRNRIIHEYDSLVEDLVKEIGVLRHRFHEYQIGSLNDVMNIMAEAKKEQLMITTQNDDLPPTLRATADSMIQHEQQLATFREQNHELKMTVLKLRSIFGMKEQALKCTFEKQQFKLATANKEAEEKLWDNYRDAEARERALRKQLGKLQKGKSTIETQNENLQRQLREEQTKPRGTQSLKAGTGSVSQMADRTSLKSAKGDKARAESKSQKLTELEDQLRRYEGINIDNLMQELSNKTALLESLIQEKRDREKKTPLLVKDGIFRSSKSGISTCLRSKNVVSRQSDMITSQLTTTQKNLLGGEFSSKKSINAAVAAEPISSNDVMSADVHFQMVGNLQWLMRENKALRRKLFLNGISLPDECKTISSVTSGYTTPYFESELSTCVMNSRVASPERPRTAISHGFADRRSAGILRHVSASRATSANQPSKLVKRPVIDRAQADLPPLEKSPIYQRLGSGKQVGFVRTSTTPESINSTRIVSIPFESNTTKGSRQLPEQHSARPQTVKLALFYSTGF